MKKYDFGLIGLGVMGRNFILNIAEKGYSALGYDIDKQKIKSLETEASGLNVKGKNSLDEFVAGLSQPRKIMMLVPADVVDKVIDEMLSLLDTNDMIIDGGNSHPYDTRRRMEKSNEMGIRYIGVGISGGPEGARRGPSMMPGGDKDAYEHIKNIFEKVAIKVNGSPCVAYLGSGFSGHFVKTVHNGIEYGIMQLISESYDLMKNGLKLTNKEMQSVFESWNKGKLESYLVEITAHILSRKDKETGGYLVDHILDSAKQKGTGKWTSQLAMDLQVPVPSIDIAVSMRDMSGLKQERIIANSELNGPEEIIAEDKEKYIRRIENALYFAMLIVYTQGFELLRIASETYKFNLALAEVAKIWRGGCIIRAAILEDIYEAFNKNADLSNLLLDHSDLSKTAEKYQKDARKVVQKAIETGIPVPGFFSTVSYFDAYRSNRLPANLIQAQRDYFGSHNYQRNDMEGVYHTKWQF